MESKKIINIVLSIISAIALWAYVINVVNPPVTDVVKGISVTLEGVDILKSNGLTIAGDGQYTVDIEASATRADMAGLSSADFVATASVNGLQLGQNYITVSVEGPGNISIDEVRSQRIQVYVDELVTEEKPLTVHYTDVAGDLETTVLATQMENVPVTGAKSFVDTVKQVRVNLDVSQLECDSPQTEKLWGDPLDGDGNLVHNVELSDNYIAVTAVLYKIKNVPIDISVIGSPGLGASVESRDIPTSVNIKGSSQMLDTVERISCDSLNIEGITKNTTLDITYQLPENVYLSNAFSNHTATFYLSHKGEITFNYTSDQIEVRGLDDAFDIEIPQLDISMTAKGELDVVRGLEAKDMQPMIDLTQTEQTAGQLIVPVLSVLNKSGIDDWTSNVGTVQISLLKKDAETEAETDTAE